MNVRLFLVEKQKYFLCKNNNFKFITPSSAKILYNMSPVQSK